MKRSGIVLFLLILCLGGALLAAGGAEQQVLSLLNAGRSAEAAELLVSADVTGAVGEFVRARIALDAGDSEKALHHLSRLQAFYYREVDWLPPALYYEALICEKNGTPETGVSALQELLALYPESLWGRKARQEFESN